MTQPAKGCPYCGLEIEAPASYVERSVTNLTIDNALGSRAFVLDLRVCPNQGCRGLTAKLDMHTLREDNRGTLKPAPEIEHTWRLLPNAARALPEHVPMHVRKEYDEAYAIKESSPNASAALARRCLQAMIRDFWGIQKGMLSAEIDALREKVEPETWNAIESVRAIGQIGSHLEKGANLILEAAPDESEILLNLIQFLVEDWYEARHKRQSRLTALRGTTPLSTPKR